LHLGLQGAKLRKAVTRPIVFLSDFGYRNEWVGICHAVMNRVAPESQIVDLSHGVPPLDVLAGALVLADSLPYLHPEAVVLAVVDPSVGRDRDIALRTGDGRLLVGPDNGLLAPAWRVSEGIAQVVSVTSPSIVIEPISPSLHARDVLAPAAAHLAVGKTLDELGPSLEPDSLAELRVPEPAVEPGKITCEVLDLNRFGNVQLNVREPDLAAAGLDGSGELVVEAHAGAASGRQVVTYADLTENEWGLMIDPRGWLSVIRSNPGNAAENLGVGVGDIVWLTAKRNSA
jgi:S-adenosyl-L-methionine hydrolase (adenosine-forming)